MKKKRSRQTDTDPIEAQLRFEAAFYGDWYSESILTSYLEEKASVVEPTTTAIGPRSRLRSGDLAS